MRNARTYLVLISFFIGLFCVDRAVLFVGDSLSSSPYWGAQRIYEGLARSQPFDGVILGSCRAALAVDSEMLTTLTGKKFINAGVYFEGFGQMRFNMSLFKDRARGKYIVMMLDDGLFSDVQTITDELEERYTYWSLLKPEEGDALVDKYHLSKVKFYLNRLGFWKYRGLGYPIAGTLWRMVRHNPVAFRDNYAPSPNYKEITKNFERDIASLESNRRPDWIAQPDALAAFDDLLTDAIKSGAKPILVVAPMNRYRGTDQANEKQIANAKRYAQKYNVPLLVYLDNHGAIANNDSLWRDAGHFNITGAEAFTKILAADLQGLLK